MARRNEDGYVHQRAGERASGYPFEALTTADTTIVDDEGEGDGIAFTIREFYSLRPVEVLETLMVDFFL